MQHHVGRESSGMYPNWHRDTHLNSGQDHSLRRDSGRYKRMGFNRVLYHNQRYRRQGNCQQWSLCGHLDVWFRQERKHQCLVLPHFSQKWLGSLLSKHYELTCFSALDTFPCAESAQFQPQHRQPASILKVLEHSMSLRNLAPFGKEMLIHSGLSVNDINCSLTTYLLVFSLGRLRKWKWL